MDVSRVVRLTRHRGMLAAFAGAVAVLAFAPFSIYPLAPLSLAALFLLWSGASPSQAFRIGWLYGLGMLGFGVSWLHVSIDRFGNVGTPLAILFTAAFVAAMSLYPALAGWLAVRLGRGFGLPSLVLVWPAVWVLLEWLKGWALTGFPWLSLGYSQIDAPIASVAPLLGVYGVSLLVALSAGLLAWLVVPGRRWLPLLVVALIWLVSWGLGQVRWTRAAGAPLQVSLLQAGIPQELKWQPEQLLPTLRRYLALTEAHWDSDLIIWPETAVPAFRDRVEGAVLEPLAAEARRHRSEVLLGIPARRASDGHYFNALLSLGRRDDAYYKRHLVPFGEFLPFAAVLRPLLDFMRIPMSDFTAGTEPRPLLRVGNLRAGISICYEDAFGAEVIEALPEAAFLVNVSNDAWFGDSLAPHQHLEIARMRALESGRFLLRATNTGISAVIGPAGGLTGTAPAFREAVLTRPFRPMSGSTPYSVIGNWGILVLLLCLVTLGTWAGRRFDRAARNPAPGAGA